MDDYKENHENQNIFNSSWAENEYIPDDKYIGNKKITDSTFYTLESNPELNLLISHILNQNDDIDDAYSELSKRIHQITVPSPIDLLNNTNFFIITANYAFDSSKTFEQKTNGLDILIFMSLIDIPESSEFTNIEFIHGLIDSFSECHKSLIPYYVNLFLNCLSDETIFNGFSEKCFNCGLLRAIQNHFYDIDYAFYIINLIYRYLQISISPMINLITKIIENEEEDLNIEYFENPFMDLVPYFNEYIENAKNIKDFNYKSFICVQLLTDLNYSKKAILESNIPKNVLDIISNLNQMDFDNIKCFALMSLFNKLCELNTKYGQELFNQITIQFCNYFPENESELKIFMDFIRRASLLHDQMKNINQMKIFNKLIDKSKESNLKTNKEIAFMFASILTKAIESSEKYEWIHDAVELVFETILSFKGERLIIILLEIRNWFNSDDFDAWELSKTTNLQESLEEIIDMYQGEIVDMCEEIIAFLNQESDE